MKDDDGSYKSTGKVAPEANGTMDGVWSLNPATETFSLDEPTSTAGVAAPRRGIRLLQDSAKALAVIRDQYGLKTSTEDVIVTIHVMATDTTPGGVFTYMSRPVFLSLSPTFLVLVGGYPLIPPIKQLLIYFVSDDCNAQSYDETVRTTKGVWNESSLVYQEAIAQMHTRLKEALIPDAGAAHGQQMQLRGKLVRHKISHKKWGLHPDYLIINPDVEVTIDGIVTFPTPAAEIIELTAEDIEEGNNLDAQVDDSGPQAEIVYEGQDEQAFVVVILTVIAGVLVGCLMEWFFLKWARRALRLRYKEAEISFKMGIRMQGLDVAQAVRVVQSRWFIPFEMPIALFKIVCPYQTSFLSKDSLTEFFEATYKPTDECGRDGNQEDENDDDDEDGYDPLSSSGKFGRTGSFNRQNPWQTSMAELSNSALSIGQTKLLRETLTSIYSNLRAENIEQSVLIEELEKKCPNQFTVFQVKAVLEQMSDDNDVMVVDEQILKIFSREQSREIKQSKMFHSLKDGTNTSTIETDAAATKKKFADPSSKKEVRQTKAKTEYKLPATIKMYKQQGVRCLFSF
jgi:hypothetical protein